MNDLTDLTDTARPKTDQQNYEDFQPGETRDATVEMVKRVKGEQPLEIHLVEYPGKCYRPSKTMRKLLISAWGKDGTLWSGRRLRLYGDPAVKYGGKRVGGIKVSHVSHIDRTVTLMLTETRGQKVPYSLAPLKGAAPDTVPTPVMPTADDVAGSTDVTALRAMWQAATGNPERQAQIQERVAELSTTDKDN